MRLDTLYVAGVGTYLPEPTSVRAAVAAGYYAASEAAETDLESVLVASHETAPDMAVDAAKCALAGADVSAAEIGLVLHASVCFQGLDFYPTAAYVQHRALGDNPALSLEVKALSNGGLIALELAAACLVADPAKRAALITTADKFCQPWIDRWRSDTGMVMADGAAALILSKRPGFARLLSVASHADPTLEGLHRGQAPFTAAPLPIEVHERKRQFLSTIGLDTMLLRFRAGLRLAVQRALSDARASLSDIDRFVLPNVGRVLLEREYFRALEIPEERTTWAAGRKLGHMGAGDQIVGLAQLRAAGALQAGERCLLMGVGAGFTWTCAVLEIVDTAGRNVS